MKKISSIIFLIALLACTSKIKAQGTYIPLGYDETYHTIDRMDIKYGKILPLQHTNAKPFSRRYVGEYAESMYLSNVKLAKKDQANLKYLALDNTEWVDSINTRSRKPFLKIFYREPASLFSVDVKNFDLRINPILNLQAGYNFSNKEFLLINTRGAEMRAYIKKKVGIYMSVTDNQTLDPLYVQKRVAAEQAVPGNGYWKEYRTRGFDYFDTRGYVTANVLNHIDITLGHDKNFIGNGYRSLMLSDNAAPYFFLKLNTKVWRVNYQNIFTQFVSQYNRGTDNLLPKKYGAFHHLNVGVTNWLDLGVFEGVTMERSDHFELQYLNPIIFYRSIEQSLGSPDNALIGLDFKVNFLRHVSVYGQFVLDEFNFKQVISGEGWWANKYGYQLGAKYIDVAGIKNLDAQFEFNTVRPYTYSHTIGRDNPNANYTHYNQQLAHPLGANFREYIAIVRYQPLPELRLKATFIHSDVGADTSGSHWGSNIFLPTSANFVEHEYGNKTLQGVHHSINYFSLLASYQIKHNINFDLSYSYRGLKSDIKTEDYNDSFFMIGTRINIPYKSYTF